MLIGCILQSLVRGYAHPFDSSIIFAVPICLLLYISFFIDESNIPGPKDGMTLGLMYDNTILPPNNIFSNPPFSRNQPMNTSDNFSKTNNF